LEKILLVITNTKGGIKKLEKYIGLGFIETVLTNSSLDRKKLVKLISKERDISSIEITNCNPPP
jgi:hypothetical protein